MDNPASARSRRWRRHRGLSTGAARNTSGATTALRSGLGSTYRLALGRRDDDGPETFRSFLCLRSTLRHHRSHDARSKDGNQTERRGGRAQPALDRTPVASIGVALAGMMTRTSMAWRKMTMIYEIQHLTARRRSPYPSARSLSPSALAPSGRCFSYSCDIGAPRPTRSRMTMTGSRFPGSRVIASDHLPKNPKVSSGIYGRRLSAYSCGGSHGFAHQYARTAFPWLALAGTTVRETGIGPC